MAQKGANAGSDSSRPATFSEHLRSLQSKLAHSPFKLGGRLTAIRHRHTPERHETVRRARQAIVKADPGQIETLKRQMKELGVFDVERMRAQSEGFVKYTNDFFQKYRIFCVSKDRASERMWEDYAQDHEGIVLRIEPSAEVDSKFTCFRAVTYREARPAVYDQTLDFMKDSLFADQEARTKATVNKIIYAKTLKYRFENEYRLAFPSDQDGDWEPQPYHPQEITELYLGLAMAYANRRDILAKARAVNPKIRVFRADRDAQRRLTFHPI